VTSSTSIVDFLEALEAGVNAQSEGDLIVDEHGNPSPPRHPSLLGDPKRLDPLIEQLSKFEAIKVATTRDVRTATVIVRTNLSGSRRIEETLERIRLHVAEHFPADIPVNLTGALVVFHGDDVGHRRRPDQGA
jgi:hypothetical protein